MCAIISYQLTESIMILKNYTQTRANKLARLTVPDITEPFGARILWLRSLSVENSDRAISRHKHKHSYFEAHFMFSGAMEYDIDGKKAYRVDEGYALLVAPEITHTVTGVEKDLIKISVAFTPTENGAIFTELASKGSLLFKLDKDVTDAFDTILSEADVKGTLSPYIIREKIFSVLCAIIRYADAESSAVLTESPENDVRIASAIRYIEDNKNIFLTCEDVAEYCHFNVKYLNRIFKKQTSLTLLEYIHSVKIREAERLLCESEHSLGDIAQMLGFANVYYFNSFFKRSCGISPGTYRKLMIKQ